MNYEWLSIALPGFSGFEISADGKVRNPRTGRVLKQRISSKGYPTVGLWQPGRKSLPVLVHRAVAATFIGPCPEGHAVNHINGIKTDNRATNLEYMTLGDNNRHAIAAGLVDTEKRREIARRMKRPTKLSEEQVREIRRRRAAGEPRLRIAEEYGVDRGTVSNITLGRAWKDVG